jgi:hypothetical protein
VIVVPGVPFSFVVGVIPAIPCWAQEAAKPPALFFAQHSELEMGALQALYELNLTKPQLEKLSQRRRSQRDALGRGERKSAHHVRACHEQRPQAGAWPRFSPDGRTLASGDVTGMIRFWPVAAVAFWVIWPFAIP